MTKLSGHFRVLEREKERERKATRPTERFELTALSRPQWNSGESLVYSRANGLARVARVGLSDNSGYYLAQNKSLGGLKGQDSENELSERVQAKDLREILESRLQILLSGCKFCDLRVAWESQVR